MKYKDYYEVLGLPRSATQDDIRRTYRKLARKYHPDLSKLDDAEPRFKELGEAYGVLKDTEKRAAYDRMGDQWRNGQDFEPPPQWDEGFEFSGGDDRGAEEARFSEFFEALFRGEHANGGRASTRRARHAAGAGDDRATAQDMEDAYGGVPHSARGQDHHAKVVIDLEDTYRGAQRTISLETPVLDASGRAVLKSRTLDVSIPKGVHSGQHLRLAGQGGAGFGEGRAGDLYLEIALRQHGLFSVDGRDVTIVVPVAPWEAALGARITVPTPDGAVEIAIPKDSSAGRRLRLKGKGIPASGPAGPSGDLYAQLNIVLPLADSEQARAAYETLRAACDFDPRAHFSGDAS
ncbi:DnaJ C-terminal domain-containing protein [Paraburkholderia phytofirmans]|uniref:Cytochrome C biogenesis protein n=1 Tax=Paraburkholderia phytofirmans OLGA172 TaxID=1417228 RepID=A0A161HZR0_9BURK|nr:DnaJ C-terminal domain-containing protein [Paraburkholderia phytofirmans]ANB76187.1 cytochrome C biogenesis protein [Paraburkholderia phytofirmans OLGA172]